jgi:hypothetical protein
MAIPGTKATTLIITKGLACGNTLDGNSIIQFGAGITPFFSLYIEFTPPPEPTVAQPYVARVLQPGEIQTLYQVLPDDQQYFVIPREKEAEYFAQKRVIANIRIKLGDNAMEKTFAVPAKHTGTVIKAINFINTTRDRIKVAVNNIKAFSTSIRVFARNLHLRNNSK